MQLTLLESRTNPAGAPRQTRPEASRVKKEIKKRAYGSGSLVEKGDGVFQLRFQGRKKSVEASGKKEAEHKLRDWIEELAEEEEKTSDTSFEQLFQGLMLTDLREQKRKDIRNVEQRYAKHIGPAFGKLDGAAIAPDHISKYISKRLANGAENATVNRELAIIRRTLRLAWRERKIKAPLDVRRLTEKNVRQGFVEDDVYRRMLAALPDHLKPFWVVGAHVGMRRGALGQLRWAWVDWTVNTITVPEAYTKNGRRHVIPIYGDMLSWLKIAWTQRNPECPYIFQYRGAQIKWHYKSFNVTREKLGLPELIFHDLRRTAIRNMERAGIPRREAMRVSNHETESVYGRYAIADEKSAIEVGRRMDEYRRKQAGEKKKISENCAPNCAPDEGRPN